MARVDVYTYGLASCFALRSFLIKPLEEVNEMP